MVQWRLFPARRDDLCHVGQDVQILFGPVYVYDSTSLVPHREYRGRQCAE